MARGDSLEFLIGEQFGHEIPEALIELAGAAGGVGEQHAAPFEIHLQPFAFLAQAQIAVFFASHGAMTVDPDGASPIFETPIALPLPETLNFIP